MPDQRNSASEESGRRAYLEFEFDLPQALLANLVDALEGMEAAELCERAVADIPDEQGVYQLFLNGALVYVGKTDGDAGLSSRLRRHAIKMLQRHNLEPSMVSFKAVRVFVFTAMDLEGDLIRHYGGVRELAWNGSGFGSNDPGKERDTSKVKPDHFDAQFPINIDLTTEFRVKPGASAAEILSDLKSMLPYTLRFQSADGSSRKPHRDLETTELAEFQGQVSVREMLRMVVSQLPTGWHVTALPGYIIMYKNDKRSFPSGTILATST